MVYFKQLQQLSVDMEKNKMPSAVFSVEYNRHFFSCVFINNFSNPLLIISSVGADSFTIRLEGDSDFNFRVYLGDRYRDLVRYLGLKYDPDNKFRPDNFFKEFDGKIPSNCKGVSRPSVSEMARSVNYSIGTIDDADKIYFMGWRNLQDGHNVSEPNFYKSCALVGFDTACKLRENRISSCWSNVPKEENLNRIGSYIKLLQE